MLSAMKLPDSAQEVSASALRRWRGRRGWLIGVAVYKLCCPSLAECAFPSDNREGSCALVTWLEYVLLMRV